MIEPIAVTYHSLEMGRFKAGMDVVVPSAGMIGLATAKCLKAMGANKIFVVQRKRFRSINGTS